jgi:hypothetical protein
MELKSMSLVKFLISVVFIVCALPLVSQKGPEELRPIARELLSRKQRFSQTNLELFERERSAQPTPDFRNFVEKSEFFHLKTEAVSQLHDSRPELIQLPISHADQISILDLYRVDIFSEQYQLSASDGQSFPRREDMIFYRGIVSGDDGSIATVSIIEEEVRILFSSREGNHRMHRVSDEQYVFYKDSDVHQTHAFSCDVTEAQVMSGGSGEHIQQRSVLTGNCVEVYFECDYKSYQDNGNSVVNTEAWVATLFNEVATMYENEDIPISISDIMVWNTTDPYASLTSTGAMLSAFITQTSQNGYDGRLAHLLSTRPLFGGIAYIDVLCHNTLACAVSTSLSTTIVPFPNYSWNINCVTHEMGHNFGSQHTHNCVWNGNNTQIDDCGSEYGNEQPCYDEQDPILPVDGTIMSYCHLVGVGVNFSLGFGPQPGNLIRNEYENASCNTGNCTPPGCTNLSSPLPLATLVEVSSNISWLPVTGVDGYRLTIGTTPTSGNIVNNVDVGLVTTYNPASNLPFNTIIYVKVVPYNSAGNAVGCTNDSFTTEANVAPACTQLTSPTNGAVNVAPTADLFWLHSVGNQTGYKITIGTTPGGGQILNLFNVGNVTTYNPATLPSNTTVYVKITPYWTGGDITGCTIVSFTTADASYCSSAGVNQDDEWISGFSLGTFSNSSGAQGYSNFTNLTAHVAAGGSYTASITPGYDGPAFPEYFRIWIDSNHDGIFQNPGERVLSIGSATGTVSGTVNIPVNSYIGTTRMRVSMRYGGYSTPCQTFEWGEVEDYTVHIHCNLVSTTTDAGVGSLPWAVDCVSSGETITFKSTLNGQTILLEDFYPIIDSPMSIVTTQASNIKVHGLTTQKVFKINAGVTASISGLDIIAGTASEGSAIDNLGTLSLTNIEITPHVGLNNAKLIKNTGILTLHGNCMIH